MEELNNRVFTEIEIHATTEEVWSVLTDWDRLKEWSTSFIGISSDGLAKGIRFIVYFKNPLTGEIMEFERVCSEYEEGITFGWSGSLNSLGMTDHHIYSLEPTESGTTIFRQEDGIHGPHSKFINFLAKHHMKSWYKKFDQQLKERVEAIYLNK